MSLIELLLIAIGLAMDAFAVSVVKGLAMKQKLHYGDCFRLAFAFGLFQAIMPFLGYFLGDKFAVYIDRYSHWISFALLAFIGAKMIIDSIRDRLKKVRMQQEASSGTLADADVTESGACDFEYQRIQIREIFALAVATSIDAFAVGVTFALTPGINIAISITIIGSVTFVISFVAVHIGAKVGSYFQTQAEIVGGIILISIGIKILLEGLHIIS